MSSLIVESFPNQRKHVKAMSIKAVLASAIWWRSWDPEAKARIRCRRSQELIETLILRNNTEWLACTIQVPEACILIKALEIASQKFLLFMSCCARRVIEV
jgi:hypothetical protein